jgi:hypothetical protein
MSKTALILMISFVGMLSACVSGHKQPDTYVSQDGKTTIIETDKEMCERSCNEDYSRCMDSSAAQDNSGLVDVPHGMFGASADCRSSLQKCLPTCKGQ